MYLHNPKAQECSSLAGRDKDAAPVHKSPTKMFLQPAWAIPLHVLKTPVTIKSPYKDLLRFFRAPNHKFTYFYSKDRKEYAIDSLMFAKHQCSAHRAEKNLRDTFVRLQHAKKPERKLLHFLLAYCQQSCDAFQKVAPVRKTVSTQIEIMGLLMKIMASWPSYHRTRILSTLRLFKKCYMGIERDVNRLIVCYREGPILQANERFIEHMARIFLIHNSHDEDLDIIIKNLQDTRYGAKSGQGIRKLQYDFTSLLYFH
jgi:hypothetical protein